MNRSHYLLAAILLAVVAAQAGLIALFPTNFGLELDTREYLGIANNLLEKGSYSLDGVSPTRMRQPLYPLFLFLVMKIAGPNLLVVEIVQATITILALLLWYLIGQRVWNDKVALISTLIVVPFLAPSSVTIMSETLFALLLFASLYFAILTWRKNNGWLSALAGLFGGLATLTRAEVALVPLLVVLVWLLSGRFLGPSARESPRSLEANGSHTTATVSGAGRRKWRDTTVLCLALLIGYASVVLPWAVRNYRSMGEFTYFSSTSGYNLWALTRMDVSVLGEWHTTQPAPWREPGFMAEFERITGGDYYYSPNADAKFKAKFLENLRRDPVAYAVNNIYKTAVLWSVPPGSRVIFPWAPFVLKATLTLLQLMLFVLAAIGSWVSRSLPEALLVLLLLLYFLLAFTLFVPPSDRLLAFPQFFMLMLASNGFYHMVRRPSHKQRHTRR